MAHEAVCAVVITFHPSPEALQNIALIQQQVNGLVVVDNGSPAKAVSDIRRLSVERGFSLIENAENLGIAAALNQGIRSAAANGYEWVALFDQDSTVTPGFMDAMFRGVQHARSQRTAIYCPRYVDRASSSEMLPANRRGGGLQMTRTSGSLVPMWVFQQCGWFVEEMVIDQVDFEYCLRLRSRGLEIVQCREATLLHSLGTPVVHRLLGVRLFGTTNHVAARRYYLARNRTWLLKKYWLTHPIWCLELCLLTLKESAKILLVEEHCLSKLGHTMLGLRDGVIGRMGMTVKL